MVIEGSVMVRNVLRFVAYYRVSTKMQGASGLGLDAQRAAVERHVAAVGGRLVGEPFVEVESGRKNDRPQLAAALAACRKHRAVLVVAKLDRLARNVAFISNLMDSGIEFVAADMPQVTRLTAHILSAVAEEEARMISARTKAALAAAKARGKKLGGYRENAGDVRPHAKQGGTASGAVRREKAEARAADLAPVVEELRAAGDTFRKIAEGLNARGIRAARGGEWSAIQVSRLLSRLEEAA
jgi:DNA invertase Pin-like site-specific DNA recombinase